MMSNNNNNNDNNNTVIKACEVFPPFPVCSGNGICDTSIGKCICNDGWSSIGDFASIDGVDCNINIIAVKVLEAITIIVALVSCIRVLICIIKQVKQYRDKKEGSLNGYFTSSARVYPIWILLMIIIAFINGCYRFVYPLRVIGTDVGATVIFILYNITFAFAVTTFSKVVIRFLYDYTAKLKNAASIRMRRQVKIVMSSSNFFNIAAFFVNSIPFLCMAFPNNQYEVGAAFYISLCTWNVSAALVCAIGGIHTMILLLEEHLREANSAITPINNKLQDLLVKLKKVRFNAIMMFPGPIIGWLVVGLSRTFSRQSTYFISYIFTNALFVTVPAVALIISNNIENSKDKTPVHPSDDENQTNLTERKKVVSVNSTNSGIISPIQNAATSANPVD